MPEAFVPQYFSSSRGSVIEASTPEMARVYAESGHYTPATPEDIKRYKGLQEARTPIEQLKTLPINAADVMSAGLSTKALEAAGVIDPEAQKYREEVGGVLGAVGTAAGLVGPAAVKGAATAGLATARALGVARAAEAGATAAEAAKAGELAFQAAKLAQPAYKRVLSTAASLTAPELASSAGNLVRGAAGVPTSRLAKMLVEGAAGGVEAATWRAGEVAVEEAVGDPNQTATSLLSEIGLAGALGAAIGAPLGGLFGKVAPKTAKDFVAAETTGASKTWVEKLEDAYINKTAKRLEIAPEEIRDFAKNADFVFPSVQAREAAEQATAKTLQEASDLHREISKSAREVKTAEVKELLGSSKATDAMLGEVQRVDDYWNRVISTLESKPAEADQALLRQLKARRENFVESTSPKNFVKTRDSVVEEARALQKALPEDALPEIREELRKRIAALDGSAFPAARQQVEALRATAASALDSYSKIRVKPIDSFGMVPGKKLPTIDTSKLLDGINNISTMEAKASDLLQGVDFTKRELSSKKFASDFLRQAPSARNVQAALDNIRKELKAGQYDEAVWGPVADRLNRINSAESKLIDAHLKIAEGHNSLFYKDKTAKGRARYIANPEKVKGLIDAPNTPAGKAKLEELADYLERVRDFHDELSGAVSFSKTIKGLDKESVKKALDATEEQVMTSARRGELSRTRDLLSPQTHVEAPEFLGPEVRGATVGAAGYAIMGGPGMAAVSLMYSAQKARKNPVLILHALGKLKQIADKQASATTSLMGSLLKVKDFAYRGAVKVAPYAAAAESSERSMEERRKSFAKTAKHFEAASSLISSMATSPEALSTHLAQASGTLGDFAPKTSVAYSAMVARAVTYLERCRPKPPVRGFLPTKLTPSKVEMDKWLTKVAVVGRPSMIFELAKKGALNADIMGAVKEVHPAFYSKVQQDVLSTLASGNSRTPYQTKLKIGTLFGADVDGSVSSMRVFQDVFTGDKNRADGQQDLRRTTYSKLSIANRSMTDTASLLVRGNK